MFRPASGSSSSSRRADRSVLWRRKRLATVLAIALSLIAAPSRAHFGDEVVRAERLLKIDVDRDRVRVIVSISLGESAARSILLAADTSGDHAIDRTEADAYIETWTRALRDELPVLIDGAPPDVDWGGAYLDPLGPIRISPCTVEVVGVVPLERGAHHLVFTDRMGVERYERTDVVFVARAGAHLVASGYGAAPSGILEQLAYPSRLPAEARDGTFGAEFEVEGGPQNAASPPHTLVLGGLVVVALVSLSALAYWRRLRGGRGS